MALGQRKPEGVVHHSDRGSQGRFKRSSQQWLWVPVVGTPPEPQPACASPASCAAGRSASTPPPPDRLRCARSSPCPWESTAAATRSCPAAMGCADRRSIPPARCPGAAARAAPSRPLGLTSEIDEGAAAACRAPARWPRVPPRRRTRPARARS